MAVLPQPLPARGHAAGPCRSRGFTLVELLAVLLLCAVLGLVVANRFAGNDADVALEAGLFQSAVRYAQARAMDDVSTWGISVADDGASYRLFTNNPDIPAPVLPGSGGERHVLPAGVTVSSDGAVADGQGHSIIFDYRGRPVASGGLGTAAGTCYLPAGPVPEPLAAAITVTFAGSAARVVTVSPQTGFAR